MPIVTAAPRSNSNGEVVTEFLDTVNTIPTTYTFLNTQEKLKVKNNGYGSLQLTVNGSVVTVLPTESKEFYGSIDSFVISSSGGVQSFEVVGTNYKNEEIQLTGSNAQEVKIFTASVLEAIYTPSVNGYGVIAIQNLDKHVPIEVVLNGTFPKPTNTTSTPDPDTFTTVHRIYPGQVAKFRSAPASIAYRCTAGSNVKLKIACGYDLELSALPNESAFHDMDVLRFQVLCADRLSNKVFATQSTHLYFSNNGGKTWTRQNTTLAAAVKSAFYTKNGTLLLTLINYDVLRSTDDGVTFTKILTAYGWRATDGIAQDSVSGAIVFGENDDAAASALRLMRSTDDGFTWTAVLSRTTAQIRHFHSVQIDPYTNKWIATTGDTDPQVEWWESTDGITWTAIVGAGSGVVGSQMYRTLGVFFTQDRFVWATDNPLWGYDQNFVISASKTAPGTITKDFPLSGPGYAHVQFPDLWIIGTQPEGSTMSDRMARVYVSRDNGKTWQKALSWLMSSAATKGGFTWATLPDKDGNVYLRLASVDGFSVDPWWYGTLKLTI